MTLVTTSPADNHANDAMGSETCGAAADVIGLPFIKIPATRTWNVNETGPW